MIADIRRKSVVGGQLDATDLARFVMRCLRTPDYQSFGMPMSQADYSAVEGMHPAALSGHR